MFLDPFLKFKFFSYWVKGWWRWFGLNGLRQNEDLLTGIFFLAGKHNGEKVRLLREEGVRVEKGDGRVMGNVWTGFT